MLHAPVPVKLSNATLHDDLMENNKKQKDTEMAGPYYSCGWPIFRDYRQPNACVSEQGEDTPAWHQSH
jgi:hypothetical protein